jgi:hypothetical protein
LVLPHLCCNWGEARAISFCECPVFLLDALDAGAIDERQIRELRTLRFVHEASNAIFLGPPDPATL